MTRAALMFTAISLASPAAAASDTPDPRLREVIYDAGTVVTMPVKRGVVSLIMLDAEEAIAEVAAGLGGDCSKPESAWCVSAQPGGRTLFVKAKSTAAAPNNLLVVTDRRTHAFSFVVMRDEDARMPVHRLVIRTPPRPAPPEAQSISRPLPVLPLALVEVPSPTLVAERLAAKPIVGNASYSIAEGNHSQDIVPSLIFDDGRFTYLRFAGNREVPAVFHVLDDGSETLLNVRTEDELLVVDRVSRRLTLRAGSAVVGIWNDAFDADGLPPQNGTTVAGVKRALRSSGKAPSVSQEATRD